MSPTSPTSTLTMRLMNVQPSEGSRLAAEGIAQKQGTVLQGTSGSGATRQTFNYSTDRVVGNGSFGVVFQATCLETGETVGRDGQGRSVWRACSPCLGNGVGHMGRTWPSRARRPAGRLTRALGPS